MASLSPLNIPVIAHLISQHNWVITSRFAGSGKDDYSSSTQKQSIDTIATTRNTSLKQYKLNKSFNDNAAKSPSFLVLGSSTLRFPEGSDKTNCQACLSSKVTNSEINILSDCNINEIHLNIFPPSAAYVKDPQSAQINKRQVNETPQNYLNIDVHDKPNLRTINDKDPYEVRRKTSLGYFSHISLKRCDSILHISIGNSSKITKRHKRKSWILAKLWKLSHKKKSASKRQSFLSPQLNKDDIFRLSDRSLNIVNDELMITINNRVHNVNNTCSSSDNFNSYSDAQQRQLKVIDRDFAENFIADNVDMDNDGANELDCYMNEIKRREMRWYETWTS